MEYMHTVTHTCACGHIHAHTFCTWPGMLLVHYLICVRLMESIPMLSQKRSCPERRMSVNLKCKSGHVLSLDDLHVLTCALESTELVLQGKRGGQCPVLVPCEVPLLQLKLKVPPILRLHFFLYVDYVTTIIQIFLVSLEGCCITVRRSLFGDDLGLIIFPMPF